MTATLHPPARPKPETAPAVRPGVVLDGIGWETYELLRRDLDNAGQKMQVTYDRGRMALTPPLPIHETCKKVLGRMIELLTMELRIPMRSLGATTWRKKEALRGLEADECYYVQNVALLKGRSEIDLAHDPPPDLAIEVDITRHPMDRPSVYAALGVPEVWRYDGQHLVAMALRPEEHYDNVDYSLAFPFLRVAELERFLKGIPYPDETQFAWEFRDWVRDAFAPRT